MALEIGQPAPELALRDQHGATTQLAAFRGSKVVVVMFYPFAFSRVCTGELSEVRARLPTFCGEDTHLVAVSCDPMFSLRTFAEQNELTFPLLSDFWPHGRVARAYGVFDEECGCAGRSTFIVDRQGVLRWAVHNQMPQARDLEEQARVLAGLSEP